MIKVAVVIDTWFPAIGGGQINAWEISKRLAKKGVKIDVITRNNGRDDLPRTKNIRIYKLGKNSKPEDTLSKLLFIIQALNFLKDKNYDLIHTHPFLSALSAKLISMVKKTPTVIMPVSACFNPYHRTSIHKTRFSMSRARMHLMFHFQKA